MEATRLFHFHELSVASLLPTRSLAFRQQISLSPTLLPAYTLLFSSLSFTMSIMQLNGGQSLQSKLVRVHLLLRSSADLAASFRFAFAGSVIAMVGKDCVAIASDLRLGNQALLVASNFEKVSRRGGRAHPKDDEEDVVGGGRSGRRMTEEIWRAE